MDLGDNGIIKEGVGSLRKWGVVYKCGFGCKRNGENVKGKGEMCIYLWKFKRNGRFEEDS